MLVIKTFITASALLSVSKEFLLQYEKFLSLPEISQQNLKFHLYCGLLYELERVNPSSFRSSGHLRLATENDLSELIEMACHFFAETEQNESDIPTLVQKVIEKKRLFVWDHNGINTMLVHIGDTSNVIRISLVYTKANERGKGYAFAACDQLKTKIAQEPRGCILFTQLNKTANDLYEKIGYKLISS